MDRTFNINHPILFILAGIAILAVILQSVAFLIRAWKRGLELGYSKEQLKKVATSSAVFTIAPAIAIGIGIITLSGTLGIALPWIRLSVVGALVYELSAAETAAASLGVSLGGSLTAQQFTTIAWTMTVGIITGLVLIPIFCKRTTQSISSIGNRDRVWGEHFSNAIFFALIATFVGVNVSEVTVNAAGRVKALVLVVSALVMCVLGVCKSRFRWEWLNDYALPLCMLAGMAAAIPLTAWLV